MYKFYIDRILDGTACITQKYPRSPSWCTGKSTRTSPKSILNTITPSNKQKASSPSLCRKTHTPSSAFLLTSRQNCTRSCRTTISNTAGSRRYKKFIRKANPLGRGHAVMAIRIHKYLSSWELRRRLGGGWPVRLRKTKSISQSMRFMR